MLHTPPGFFPHQYSLSLAICPQGCSKLYFYIFPQIEGLLDSRYNTALHIYWLIKSFQHPWDILLFAPSEMRKLRREKDSQFPKNSQLVSGKAGTEPRDLQPRKCSSGSSSCTGSFCFDVFVVVIRVFLRWRTLTGWASGPDSEVYDLCGPHVSWMF